MSSNSNIKKLVDLPHVQPDIKGLKAFRDQLQQSQQRGLLLIEAQRDVCLSWWSLLKQEPHCILLSDLDDLGDSCIPFSKADNLLGRDTEIVILDLFSGMNVDVLCMAMGLIKAGGFMVWFCPKDVREYLDPYGQWQGQAHPRFIHYLLASLQSCPVLAQVTADQIVQDISPLADARMVEFSHRSTPQQAQMLERMDAWLRDNKQKIFILTALRGRGKSTVLGLFASTHKSAGRIFVTAASRAQASILLACLDNSEDVEFVAPDALVRNQQTIDCLIIDEAAMIPFSLLAECLTRARKVIMATTTGGYEGTGQGFLQKFMKAQQPQDYIHAKLHDPIRWGRQDLLEKHFDKALMFDLEDVVPEGLSTSVEYSVISKQDLIQDLATLKAIYGLLVSAHYRTRPSDLRQLMDDDAQRILVARTEGVIVGVMLLNQEGGFSAELTQEIFMGRRRPPGHLLAQMITAQAGIKDFAQWQGLRIQRVTVHEKYRRKGVGLQLVNKAFELVRQENLDYLGSTFALDSIVTPFWQAAGLELVHISAGRGKSTGRQTVALVQSDLPDVKRSIQLMKQKIQRDLQLWLPGYCQNLMWQDVMGLLQLANLNLPLSALDRDEIYAFSQGFRGFDLSQAALQRILISKVDRLVLLKANEQQLLVEKVLLNRPWTACAGFKANIGRKALTQKIRHLVTDIQNENSTNG